MTKPRLGILNSSSIVKSYGGIAPFIKNLDPFLHDDFDVTYIVLPDNLYDFHYIPRRLSYVLYLFWKRRQLNRFDILLSHVTEGTYMASFGKTPFVHIFHGNFNPMSQSRYWYGKYFKAVFASMEKRFIRRAALMYTVGTERPGIPKIMNPVHHDVKVKSPDSRSGFIFSGRLEKIKNIDKIIKLYARLPAAIQEENTLFIAGTGTQEAALRDLAESLLLKGQIIFLGSLNNDMLIETDSTKKILLMASSQEGFPMAIAEALSLGVPVISTDTGDISRFLKSDENGFLLPIEFSDEQYIRAIEIILRNYERFSRNALTSSAVFKAERVARSLISDMHNVISKQ